MIVERNQVVVSGCPDGQPIIFAHGFGCDQSMWRQVAPAFEERFRVITYDLTGMGRSDLSAYDMGRYADLEAHAGDLLSIMQELDLENAVHGSGRT